LICPKKRIRTNRTKSRPNWPTDFLRRIKTGEQRMAVAGFFMSNRFILGLYVKKPDINVDHQYKSWYDSEYMLDKFTWNNKRKGVK